MSDPTLLAALQATPSALLVVDGTGHIIALSDAAAEMLPGAAAGRALADLGAVGVAAAALADGARQPGTDEDGEQATVEDGGRTLRLAARPLATGADGPAPVLLTVDPAPSDPVGVQATEVLASISDAFFALDRDGRFVYVNDQAEPLLDRQRGDLLGTTLWDAFPEAVGTPFWDAYHEAVETGGLVHFDAFFEPLGRHFDVRAYPFTGGLSVSFADVTAARRTDAQFRLFTETAVDVIVTMDADSVIRYVNPAAETVFGYRPEELLGQELTVLMPESLRGLHKASLDRYLETGERRLPWGHVEVPGLRKDGATIPLAISFGEYAADGAHFFTGIIRDVSAQKAAEAAGRQSEERYRFLSESLQQQIWTAEPDGHLDYVNRFVLDYVGRTADEMIGAGWQDVVHPDDLPAVAERWGRALETGEPYGAEFRLLRASDRTYRWHTAQADALVEDGRVVKWFGANVDVHEQKEAEAAVRRSEERARLALDAAHLGLWSSDLATDAGTQDARTQEILRLTPGEQITMAEAFERSVHSDDLAAVQAAVAAATDPAGEGRLDVEFRVPRPDEPPCWARATARTTFEGDRPAQMVGTLADVTAQKETAHALLAVVDGLPELAWSALPDGHIDFYNRRWYDYTGTTFEEIEGWGWEAVHDPAVLPEVVARWRHALATGEPFEMEFPLRRADGAFRWFLTRATPLRDEDGRPSRWIGVNTDVHVKRRAETQARFLAESGRLAEEALDLDAALARLAELAVPGFADWCSITLRHDDGSLGAVAIAHQDPEKVRWGWELQDLRPVDPDAPTGAAHVIRTGQSELYPDIPDEMLVAAVKDEEELALLRSIGFSSVIIVPMRAGDEVVGAASFINAESGRRFDELDLAAAEEVARRAGAALETARLYRALQRSEGAAREAEGRTRALFDATPDVVLVYPLGEDGPEPLREVNEAAVETYGYSRERLLQMRPAELQVPGSVSVPDALARLRRERRARFESLHRTRDGRQIPMEVAAHLVEQDGREVVLSVCRDVTERREAEDALRERERELQTLANSIPQMTWMADASGTVLWFNQRWYDYTGTTPEGPVGQGITPLIHPDEADRVAASYLGAFEAGQPWEDTFRILGADGDYRWFLSRAVPIHAAGDRVARWFGTNTDVTEERELLASRDEALARLHQSQERHRLALEGGQMGTWEWDITEDRLEGDERVAGLWGTEPHAIESVAEFYDRLVHPDDLPDLQGEVERALAGEATYAAEYRVVRPDGRVRWIANRGRVVHDASGAPARMFGLSFDVTERRESEEALRRKNTEMEQFAYTISHDLKSPLVTITGFLGVLKGQLKAGQTDRALASADRVLGAADRMGRLIEDLLHLSRAGRVTGEPQPVELDGVVGGLADALSGRVREAGGTLHIQPGLGTVLADEPRLSEVVENLLANAVTYGLGGGGTRIGVSSERVRGGGLRLAVEDDGPGVPQAYRQKVFELFQRLDASGDGTGIGLALVARIMDVMGGRAYVTDARGEAASAGARFVLEFPATAVLRPPTPDATGAAGSRTSAPPTRQPTAGTASPDAPSASHDLP